MKINLSLIICSRNRSEKLKKCLDSISPKEMLKVNGELILINNNSKDNTEDIMILFKKKSPFPVVIINELRIGKSYGLNRALKKIKGEVIIFIDDDCYLTKNYLLKASKIFESKEFDYCGGQIWLYDKNDAKLAIDYNNKKFIIPPFSFLKPGTIQGANMIFHSRVINKVGLFDEFFGAGTYFAGEDIEYAARASYMGFTGAHIPELIVYHHHERKKIEGKKHLKFYYIGSGAYYIKFILKGKFIYIKKWYEQSKFSKKKFSIELKGALLYILIKTKYLINTNLKKYKSKLSKYIKNVIDEFFNLLNKSNIFISLNTRYVCGPKKMNYKKNELVVVSVVKNGEAYIKSFIDQYFSLGVKHIFLLDNCSQDNTISIAKKYKNVTIFKSKLPYRFFEDGLSIYLVKKFCKNRWCLFVDVDELFDYPFSNIISLDSFLDYLNQNYYNSVVLQMLDMFSDKSFCKNKKEKDIKKGYPYYDINNIKKNKLELYYHININQYKESKISNNISNNKIKFYSGGINKTVFNNNNWLTKHTLFLFNKRVKPLINKHLINNSDIADISGVIYHYKYLHNFKHLVFDIMQNKKNQRRNSCKYYWQNYYNILKNNPDLCLKNKKSKKIKSTNDLIKNKFLIISKKYLDWVFNKNHLKQNILN